MWIAVEKNDVTQFKTIRGEVLQHVCTENPRLEIGNLNLWDVG